MPKHVAALLEIERIFHAALPLSQPARLALFKTCPEQVAATVQELLDADALLLCTPQHVVRCAASCDGIGSTNGFAPTIVGRYRLLREIGSGGMGIVYLAERIDDASHGTIRYPAAIKFLHGRLSTASARSAFLQERDTLASFAHAGIARLLDAGTTDTGEPFVAMEYIDGRRIDAFADDPLTTAQALLSVLEQLCGAVAEAHRKLVLHRDIKPSNILVTAEHHAKLLDFGTRQLLDVTGTAAPNEPLHALTLRYASPEQLAGRTLSTGSDVYSLGLTFYRVLAGVLPPLLQQNNVTAYLRQSSANLVPPPSSQAGSPRFEMPAHLARDLDAIVLKAIRNKTEERYSSVAALLEDLQAAQAGKRVRARDNGLFYRAVLLFRNHRANVLATMTMVLLLLSGVLFSLHQKHRARILAARTQAGVDAEQHLAHFLLFDYFDQLQDQTGSIPAQRVAATEALRSLDELASHSADPSLRTDAVAGYTRLGKLLGSPYEQNLGDVPAAAISLRRAVQLARQLREQGDNTPAAREAEQDARTGLAQVLIGQRTYQEIPGWIEPAVQTARTIAADPASTSTSLLRAAVTLNTYGDLYGQESDMGLHNGPRSIAIFREAQAAYARGVERDRTCAACRSGMALESWKLGMLHRLTDSQVAAAFYLQGLQAIEALPAADRQRALTRRRLNFLRQRLAESERYLGNLQFALRLDEAARADCQDVVAHSPQDLQARRDLVEIVSQLSTMYVEAHRPGSAVETAREYVTTEDEIARLSPQSTLWQHLRFDAEDTLSQALEAKGDTAAARAMQAKAITDAIRFADEPNASSSVLNLAAMILSRVHRYPDKAVVYAERNMKDNAEPTGDELLELARAERDAGHRPQADAAIRNAMVFFATNPRAPAAVASVQELRRMRTQQHKPN